MSQSEARPGLSSNRIRVELDAPLPEGTTFDSPARR
jgi:hypothetical protein